jgi:hypothetical protein
MGAFSAFYCMVKACLKHILYFIINNVIYYIFILQLFDTTSVCSGG